MCDLIEKAQDYVDSHKDAEGFDMDDLAIIYMLRIEHLHYRYTDEPGNEELMDQLCKKVYSMKNAMLQRQRALLCQIYHHSLHDRWDKAKELLLMSHIQTIIDHSEASAQVTSFVCLPGSKSLLIRSCTIVRFVSLVCVPFAMGTSKKPIKICQRFRTHSVRRNCWHKEFQCVK